MTVGQRIREARKKAGLTQKELADKLGISYVGVSHWENGQRNPKLSTLARIADALNISVVDLLSSTKHIDYPVYSEITGETAVVDMETTELMDAFKTHKIPFTTDISGLTGSINMIEVDNWNKWGEFYDETEGIKELLKMFYVSLETKLIDDPHEMGLTVSSIEEIIDWFLKLNPDGHDVAIERIKELTEIPRYQKKPPQAEDQDGENADDTPQEGD